jgi:hypothetical protein
MAKIGPIIPDRVAPKAAPKPAPKPAGPTKAQVEAAERAQAAAEAKAAAERAEAARQRKAEVERQESAAAAAAAAKAAAIASEAKRDQVRADAHAAEQRRLAAERDQAARQTKAQIEREEMAEYERIQWILKNGPRGADALSAWLESPGYKAPATSSPSGPSGPSAPAAPKTPTNNNAQAEAEAAAARAAEEAARLAREQAERDRLAREQAERDRLSREAAERASEEARLDAIARMPVPLVVAPREPVKYATPDDVLIDTNDLPVDLILKLALEKIGGLELINLVRHDTVNGQNIVYRPVKNISQIAIDYNPQNIIKMPDSADSYFKNFSIKLENHIQQTTNELPPLVAYIDETTQNVVIDLVNLKADYEVEVQMVSSGKVFNDTIYTEDS